MSRNKGKRAEREIVAALQPVVEEVFGIFRVEAPIIQRNTLQSDRGGFDLVGLDWLAPEVKHCETFNLKAWWEQCAAQAKGKTEPVLFYRKNQVAWRVRMRGQAGRGTVALPCLVDISLDAFLLWFRQRLTHELAQLHAMPEPAPCRWPACAGTCKQGSSECGR